MPNVYCLNRNKGFTLVELLIVLIIISIMAAVALPRYKTWVLNNKSVAVRDDLLSVLMYARTEAVKSVSPVSICASSDGENCVSSGTGLWNVGIIIYRDTEADISSDTAVGEVLRFIPAFPANVFISAKRGADSVDFIRFNMSGMLSRNKTSEAVFETQVAECKGDYRTRITVRFSGTTSTTRLACE